MSMEILNIGNQPQPAVSSTGQTQGSASFSAENSLPKGTVVEGRILSVRENMAMLEVGGKKIEAKLEGKFEFISAELLKLLVLENSEDKLILKPLFSSEEMSEKRLLSILKELNLKFTPENKALVEELMGAKLPLSQENIRVLQKMMEQFPKIDIKTMVLLLKKGIPLTEGNLLELQKTELPGKQLGHHLEEIIDGLSKTLRSEKGEQLLRLLLPSDKDGQQLLDVFKGILQGKEPDIALPLQRYVGKEMLAAMAEDLERLFASVAKEETIPLSKELNPKIPEVFFKGTELKEGILSDKIKNFQDLMQLIKGLPEEEMVKEFFVEKIIRHLLRKELAVSAEETEPAKVLEKLFAKLDSLKGQQDGNPLIRELLQHAEASSDAMRFMGKFQEPSHFLQIPFLMGDALQNAKLFVSNPGKKRKQEEAVITALLQLDYLTLGHVDVFIRKEGRSLQIDFYAEDKKKEAWIQEKMYLLANQLMDRNYQIMRMKTFLQKEKMDGFADFLAKEEVKKVSRFSFDMKA